MSFKNQLLCAVTFFALTSLAIAKKASSTACFGYLAEGYTHHIEESGEWKPGNSDPEARGKGRTRVPSLHQDVPAFVAEGGHFTRRGIVVAPGNASGIKFDATFNPSVWTAVDPKDGKKKVYMVFRGEENLPNAKWKRKSKPYLAVSEDGKNFTLVQKNPLFEDTMLHERGGGIEDTRYGDLSLDPYKDDDGMTFDSVLMYTGYDGTVPRVGYALFNKNNPTYMRRKGQLFPDADILENPLLKATDGQPVAHIPLNHIWHKSPSLMQTKDPVTGKVRTILYVGEGSIRDGKTHGGIMAIVSENGMRGLKWPKDREASIVSREGKYDEGLVEAAFQPVEVDLPAWLVQKTGETRGIYLSLHGDTAPNGYQLGYRIMSLEDPTQEIYASDGPYFSPRAPYELEGQVGKVVFVSGMAELNGEILIYYGGADSVVGMASAPARKDSPEVIEAKRAERKAEEKRKEEEERKKRELRRPAASRR